MDISRKLSHFMFLSLGLHILLMVSLFVFSKFDFSILKSHMGIKSNIKISEIRSAVRVDVVSMPRKTLKELKVIEKQMGGGEALFQQVEAPPAKKAAPKEVIKEGDLVFKKKKKKQNFMSMLKNISKKKIANGEQTKKTKTKKKTESGIKLGSKYQGELKNLVLRGNQLSKGSRLTGGGEGAEATTFNLYVLSLPDHVRANWRLPSYLIDKELKCRIRIFLRTTGTLIKAAIFESSGNKEFDEKALSAVKKSVPYPPVPQEIRGRVSRGDVILGFPL